MRWIPAWHACAWRLVGPCRPSRHVHLADRSIPRAIRCAIQDPHPSTTPSALPRPIRALPIRGLPIRGLPVRRLGALPVRLLPPRGSPIRWLGGPDVSRPVAMRPPVAESAS